MLVVEGFSIRVGAREQSKDWPAAESSEYNQHLNLTKVQIGMPLSNSGISSDLDEMMKIYEDAGVV